MRSIWNGIGRRPPPAQVAVLLAVLIASASAGADQLTVNTSADARVSSANGGNNFGNGNTLQAGVTAGGVDVERSFVGFNVAFPYKAVVTAATLSLNATASLRSNQMVERVTGAWAELNVTSNNQPAVDANQSTVLLVVAGNPGVVSFDVTALVKTQFNCTTGGAISFRVKDQNEGNGTLVAYDSRETPQGTPAQLVVTYRHPNHAVAPVGANPVIEPVPTGSAIQFGIHFGILAPVDECPKLIVPHCSISNAASLIQFTCPPGPLQIVPGQTAVITIPGQVDPGALAGMTNSIVLRTVDEDGYEVDSVPIVVMLSSAVPVESRSWSLVKNLFR